jgi:alcohol dehydrogenase
VPICAEGRTLGHEAVGTVVETGDAVANVRQGDRVLVSCISACGRCSYCRQGMYGQCQSGGGWILGHLVDGTQAELARIPFADNSLYKVPEGLSDEQVLFLSDILPTGFEVGVLNGNVRPGDVVAVVGAGPVGLAAMMTARLYGPSRVVAIDKADSRLEKARSQFGADVTVNSDVDDPAAVDPQPHHHHRPGRHQVHPDAAAARLRGPPRPRPFATHRLTHDQIIDAYGVFADAGRTNALKMVLTRS